MMLRHVLSSSNEQITFRGNDYAVVSARDMPDVLFLNGDVFMGWAYVTATALTQRIICCL